MRKPLRDLARDHFCCTAAFAIDVFISFASSAQKCRDALNAELLEFPDSGIDLPSLRLPGGLQDPTRRSFHGAARTHINLLRRAASRHPSEQSFFLLHSDVSRCSATVHLRSHFCVCCMASFKALFADASTLYQQAAKDFRGVVSCWRWTPLCLSCEHPSLHGSQRLFILLHALCLTPYISIVCSSHLTCLLPSRRYLS